MGSQLLVGLVNQWAEYEQQQADPSIQDFCLWYLANKPLDSADHPDIFDEMPLNGLLGKLMGRVGQYDHLYTKKALNELGLNNVDDMMYMHMIHHLKKPRKAELISMMLSEFPSGIEIIRRLLRQSLITEVPDETDKRSRRVQLTELGEGLLLASYALLHQAGEMMYDRLSEPEKRLLVHLLSRLDDFHVLHHKRARSESFSQAYTFLMNELKQP
ncbi:MarR family winged helix-turn-helix transcriptional regulator [Nostoc sp. CHAB 5834]|nr:MarR family winged helix-turn-helix transcriptional regulator [Nostoc sp. CHAB 5834]